MKAYVEALLLYNLTQPRFLYVLTYFCSQLLRQVLDEKVLFNTKKPFDRRVLEGVVVTAAMNMQSEPVTSANHQQIPERLKVSLRVQEVMVRCYL